MAELSIIPVDPSQFKSSPRPKGESHRSDGDTTVQEAAVPVEDGEVQTATDKKRRKRRKQLSVCLTACKYDCVRRVCQRYGLKSAGNDDDWNLYWTDLSVTVDRVMEVKLYQKINHFPGIAEISRKDLLARNIMRMQRQFPADYNIAPLSWTLPADYGDFLAFSSKRRNVSYIAKPDNSCQGKGIFVTSNCKDIKADLDCVVQQYIDKPFLVDGYKFDMRIYVLVTSCNPLRIYIYKDGLARFATIKYAKPSSHNTSQACMHLTNYAINKLNDGFVHDDIAGSKRRLIAMDAWFLKNGYNVKSIWKDVEDVVIKTIISCEPVLKHSYQVCFPHHTTADANACFEILGFDVMLDSDLKPWLIEVNHSPSYHTDQAMDSDIKEGLLYDALSMLNLEALDRAQCLRDEKQRAHNRLTKQLADASQTRLKNSAKKPQSKKGREDEHGCGGVDKEDTTKPDPGDAGTKESAAAELELKNCGGWRRIFPLAGSTELYSRFFTQSHPLLGPSASTEAKIKSAKNKREHLAAKDDKSQQQKQKSLRRLPSLNGLPFSKHHAVGKARQCAPARKEDGAQSVFDPDKYPAFVIGEEGADHAQYERADLYWRAARKERSHNMQAIGIKSFVSQYFRSVSRAARQLSLTDASRFGMTVSTAYLESAERAHQQRRDGGLHPRNNSPQHECEQQQPQQQAGARSPGPRGDLQPRAEPNGHTLFHYRQPLQLSPGRLGPEPGDISPGRPPYLPARAELSLYDLDAAVPLPGDGSLHHHHHHRHGGLAPRALGTRRTTTTAQRGGNNNGDAAADLWMPSMIAATTAGFVHLAAAKTVLPGIPTASSASIASTASATASGLFVQSKPLLTMSRVVQDESRRGPQQQQQPQYLPGHAPPLPQLSVLQPQLCSSVTSPIRHGGRCLPPSSNKFVQSRPFKHTHRTQAAAREPLPPLGSQQRKKT